jgi:hypothetical protein
LSTISAIVASRIEDEYLWRFEGATRRMSAVGNTVKKFRHMQSADFASRTIRARRHGAPGPRLTRIRR